MQDRTYNINRHVRYPGEIAVLVMLSILITAGFSAQLSAAVNSDAALDKLYEDLENTKAIGIFTKLSIKNNATRLQESFGAYHKGERPPDLEDLRHRYNLMVQEMMVLVQDKDPELAREIQDTKQLLWSILSDPEKYESI